MPDTSKVIAPSPEPPDQYRSPEELVEILENVLHELTICCEPGCERPVRRRGLCDTHSAYKRRHGLLPRLVRPTEAERFWAKAEVGEPDQCWPWTGALSPRGYGGFYFRGQRRLAHRVAWMLTHHAELTPGETVDHLCFNPGCVNPGHMEIVSVYVNRARRRPPPPVCPAGHAMDGDNLRFKAGGRRWCRECNRARMQRRPRRAA